MILYPLFGLIAAGCVLSINHWRYGLYVMVLVVAIQDPIRKSLPGAPGYLALATAPVILAVLISMVIQRPGWWRSMARTFPAIEQATHWFIIACIPACFISASYGPGSWILTLLGIASYATVLMLIVVGYHFPRSLVDLRRFLGFYCVVTSVMLSGGLLEYLGYFPDSLLLGTKALEMDWIRYGEGYIVNLIAGFYRSPDIMGWHAAAVTLLTLLLAMTTRGYRRWFWLILCGAALAALFLCGRRKMVYMIPAFLVAVAGLQLLAGRYDRMLSLLGLAVVPLAILFISHNWVGDETTQTRYYTETAEETGMRVQEHGYTAVLESYRDGGFFGSGMGVATPGSHHIKVARPRVWQESGPSRVMVELGVPGLLALLFLLGSILFAAWQGTSRQLQADSEVSAYAVGLFAFFLANAAGLVVSGQILSDPFVSAFLGLALGMTLSLGRVPLRMPKPRVASIPGGAT